MERSVIRDCPRQWARPIPHYAEFIIGPAKGRTRWLHAGYGWHAGLIVLALAGRFVPYEPAMAVALIGLDHCGLDRALGYG